MGVCGGGCAHVARAAWELAMGEGRGGEGRTGQAADVWGTCVGGLPEGQLRVRGGTGRCRAHAAELVWSVAVPGVLLVPCP